MGDQTKVAYMWTLYLILPVVGLIWFSKSLVETTYDFINRDTLAASLALTREKLNKVAKELDVRKVELGRMGPGDNEEARHKAEKRISVLQQQEDQLRKQEKGFQEKAATVPTAWPDFFKFQFKDLLGLLLSVFNILISLSKLPRTPKNQSRGQKKRKPK
jgi:hypothetical protein